MSEQVTIYVGVDATQANITMDELMKRSQEVMDEADKARREVLSTVSTAMGYLNTLVADTRQVLNIIGATIDPFFSSMLSMITSSVSMIISIGIALSSTVVGAPIGAYLMAVGLGLNIALGAKIIRDKVESQRYMDSAIKGLNRARPNLNQRTPIGGSF